MNKNLILTACAAATMVFATSCDKSQEVEMNHGNAISFRTSINSLLRANNVKDLTSLQNEGFKVEAFNADKSKNLFTEIVKKKSSENIWMPENVQYWPSTGKVHFYAYTPSTTQGWNAQNKSFVDFTPAAKLTDQKDLLVAYKDGDKTHNESTGVELNFKHALSQIDIQADNASTSMTVKVKGVKIVKVNSKGTFTFPGAATVHSTNATNLLAKGSWTAQKDKSGYADIRTHELQLKAIPQDVIENVNRFMLVPQDLTGWNMGNKTNSTDGTYIALYVQISNKAGQMYPKTEGKFGWTAVPVSGAWEPGKKYTYILHFFKDGGGAGNQEPNPGVPGSNGGDTTPTEDTGVNKGEPILGAPIKFTVTVDNWIDGGTQSLKM